MNTKKEFERIMKTQTEIALATSVNNVSNVRIVNFFYDDTSQSLFFASFNDNDKVKELEQNSEVAFTTIPKNGNEHVKGKGNVRKSSLSIYDIKDIFISKMPDYKEIIEQAGQFLILYEIRFNTARVTLDFENIDTLFL
jgi:uncharacterized pyridoxamine 5'-phosphate oxidase family protein